MLSGFVVSPPTRGSVTVTVMDTDFFASTFEVAVIVAVPGLFAVTRPFSLTVATSGLVEVQSTSALAPFGLAVTDNWAVSSTKSEKFSRFSVKESSLTEPSSLQPIKMMLKAKRGRSRKTFSCPLPFYFLLNYDMLTYIEAYLPETSLT